MEVRISDAVKYIGVDDTDIDLFEGQYAVKDGVSYNSYLILDDKIAIMDTADARKMGEWEKNLTAALGGKKPDYLVVSHLEPDHSGSIGRVMELWPDITLVGSAKAISMLPQFFDVPEGVGTMAVKEGDSLSLGAHELHFYMAPMVHWPEVMVTYESKEKILFSADGFGKFGALERTQGADWKDEARRYYINIVGKYGGPVQTLLKKAEGLSIETICPLHGPILGEDLGDYIALYDTWSSYRPEDGGVTIAYASIYGNTATAAKAFAELLKKKGLQNIACFDLARDDMSAAIASAFQYDRLVLAAPSYDGGVFPCMQDFLNHLQAKAYQKRNVGLIENGSWAPSAAKAMRAILETMKEINILEPTVTIRTRMAEGMPEMDALADALL